ncbi:MAG TPA: hypothetical protein VLH84_02635 [Patescibacteria group bacterium]|nr:hypothetical protein [Patescibacteria group bacterium]
MDLLLPQSFNEAPAVPTEGPVLYRAVEVFVARMALLAKSLPADSGLSIDVKTTEHTLGSLADSGESYIDDKTKAALANLRKESGSNNPKWSTHAIRVELGPPSGKLAAQLSICATRQSTPIGEAAMRIIKRVRPTSLYPLPEERVRFHVGMYGWRDNAWGSMLYLQSDLSEQGTHVTASASFMSPVDDGRHRKKAGIDGELADWRTFAQRYMQGPEGPWLPVRDTRILGCKEIDNWDEVDLGPLGIGALVSALEVTTSLVSTRIKQPAEGP